MREDYRNFGCTRIIGSHRGIMFVIVGKTDSYACTCIFPTGESFFFHRMTLTDELDAVHVIVSQCGSGARDGRGQSPRKL